MLGKVHEKSLLSQSVITVVLEGEKIVDEIQKCDRGDMTFFIASGQSFLVCLIKRIIVRDQTSTSFNFFIISVKICLQLIKHFMLYTYFLRMPPLKKKNLLNS